MGIEFKKDEVHQIKRIDVAVGVIHCVDKYLLGFRSAQQHQGNRYEFIGGKIEAEESPNQALIREVYEEIGLELDESNIINPFGIIEHYYQDNKSDSNIVKQVCLHVFRVAVSQEQYQLLLSKNIGCEGQPLEWVNLKDLLKGGYKLPEANKTILEWLRVPDEVVITYDISTVPILDVNESMTKTDTANESSSLENCNVQQDEQARVVNWLEFHSLTLPKNSWVYVRMKNLDIQKQANAVVDLIKRRPDLSLILNSKVVELFEFSDEEASTIRRKLPKQIVAQQLTQSELESINSHYPRFDFDGLSTDLPIFISCHDKKSMSHANKLAESRIKANLAPVVAVFLSPIYNTTTHPDKPPLGLKKFTELAQLSQIPVIGLGGLNPSDVNLVRRYGGDKIAGISHFMIKG